MKRTIRGFLCFFLMGFIFYPLSASPSLFSYKNQSPYSKSKRYTAKRFHIYARKIYRQTGLSRFTDFQTFETSLIGYLNLKRKGLIKKDGLLVLIDYALPSDKERFFVIDIKRKKILYKSLVAHGKYSGERFAFSFSNKPGSYKSPLGFFITGKTYCGKHGISLFLQGVEPGINDNAVKRRIVIHGADYVSRSFIRKYGRLGRSLGCPALPMNIADSVIKTIKDGSCVFIFGRDKRYFKRSQIIKAKGVLKYLESAGI